MSQCVVPNWNRRHQRQGQLVEEEEGREGEGEERNRSTHVHSQLQNHIQAVPMSNYEVAELTWENGQLSMHGFGHGGLLPTTHTKTNTWGRTGDTLESIVHQATYHNQNPNVVPQHDHITPANMSSTGASSAGKWAETAAHPHAAPDLVKKRMRSDSGLCRRRFSSSIQEEGPNRSACASGSATICKENDATMMTWASFESPRSLKSAKTTDEDSACHDGSENLDEEQETKRESGRSHSTRRCRAAAVHNQSERKRRDRINQKMKALQKLVPNASKTDKASMLDEVIEYLKQLQAQVQMMNTARNTPQMMLPLGMQQQLQMSLLARMGMGMGTVGLGMGMGMLDMSSMTSGAPQSPFIHPAAPIPASGATAFVPPPFVVPQMIPNHHQPQATTDAAAMNNSVPFNNPYGAFLAQSMNMELYNKIAAMYQQQVNQTTQPTSSPLPSSHVQGGQ